MNTVIVRIAIVSYWRESSIGQELLYSSHFISISKTLIDLKVRKGQSQHLNPNNLIPSSVFFPQGHFSSTSGARSHSSLQRPPIPSFSTHQSIISFNLYLQFCFPFCCSATDQKVEKTHCILRKQILKQTVSVLQAQLLACLEELFIFTSYKSFFFLQERTS